MAFFSRDGYDNVSGTFAPDQDEFDSGAEEFLRRGVPTAHFEAESRHVRYGLAAEGIIWQMRQKAEGAYKGSVCLVMAAIASMILAVAVLATTGSKSAHGTDSWCARECASYRRVDVNNSNVKIFTSLYIHDASYIYGATPMKCWNTSGVTNLNEVFQYKSDFNEDLSCWDTSSVTDMSRMFYEATKFNGDVSIWDTSNVLNMRDMFSGAASFNRDISRWHTSKVYTLSGMFRSATTFNQDLCSWDIRRVNVSSDAFYETSCPKKGDPSQYSKCHKCG